jgi:hypothetical protein
MVKQFEAHKFSGRFRELWANETRTLDMAQYEACLNEWKAAHEKKTVIHYLITILLFAAGLWATYEHAVFLAVLLLALAANSNRQSSHHTLIYELMDTQRLLAMLVNKQSRELEFLTQEVADHTKVDAP